MTSVIEHLGINPGNATELARQLDFERQRADYAWRNTRAIENDRQALMAERDALRESLRATRHHLIELGKLADRAALVMIQIDPDDTDEAEKIQEIIEGINILAPTAILGKFPHG